MVEHYYILETDRKMKQIFPRPTSLVFRQPLNLKMLLVRSTFKELPFRNDEDEEDRPPGCHKHSRGGSFTFTVSLASSITSDNMLIARVHIVCTSLVA
jgi:hypothetical protein